MWALMGALSMPATEMSSGTEMPSSRRRLRTPTATWSLKAIRAVGLCSSASSTAACPSQRDEPQGTRMTVSPAASGIAEAALSLLVGPGGRRPFQVGDALVAERHEVFAQGAYAEVIVDDHGAHRGMTQYAVDQHQPAGRLRDLPEPGRAHPWCAQQHAVDPAGQFEGGAVLLLRVLLGAGDQRVVVVGGRLGRDALQDLREVRVAEVGHDDADRPAAAAEQRLRRRVRPVADLLGGRADPLGDLRRDRFAAAQHAGHRRRRHLGEAGDVVDRGTGGRRHGPWSAFSPDHWTTFAPGSPPAQRCKPFPVPLELHRGQVLTWPRRRCDGSRGKGLPAHRPGHSATAVRARRPP